MIVKDEIKLFRGVESLEVNILEISVPGEWLKYEVKNTPVCQFDQHSRARVGVKFIDYQVSEKPEYVLYTKVYDKINSDREFRIEVFKTLEELEKIRQQETQINTAYNLMTRNCSYKVEQTFSALKGQMMRRLKFCEEEFIVGLHWLLRHKMINLGIEEAKSFLPGCDLIQKCDYSSADYLSNMFGCLFKGCGRWPDESKYASFNESCTTVSELESQLRIIIPKSKYELDVVKK
jgi:hypothetical protein